MSLVASSMKQEPFIARYESQWQHFEEWIEFKQNPRRWRKKKGEEAIAPILDDLPHEYRQICHHLAMAKTRMYSPLLIDRLNHMVIQGHQYLYETKSHFLRSVIEYFTFTFPSLIRQEWKLVLISSLLFYVPFFGILILLQFNPDLVYSVMDGSDVRSMEGMYDPALRERFGREREADSDVLMFGFYIRNNTGIDFRTFAGGIAFGLGTLFFTIFNGIFIGAAAGHLTQIGYNETFWGFVCGHSSLELTAMVFSTVAGLKLGSALIKPGRKSRIRALIDNGNISMKIMYGTATMTVMAAFVEAFWSSIAWMPLVIKLSVAAVLWSAMIAYFVFMGRGQQQDQHPSLNMEHSSAT